MAKNGIYSDQPRTRRVRQVPEGTRPGTPLILNDGTPVVTITGRGDVTWTETAADGSTHPRSGGGIGLPADSATVTPTGTWAFDVTGASASTAQGTKVYLTVGGKPTLTETADRLFGVVEFFRGELSATDTAVTIGDYS